MKITASCKNLTEIDADVLIVPVFDGETPVDARIHMRLPRSMMPQAACSSPYLKAARLAASATTRLFCTTQEIFLLNDCCFTEPVSAKI